MGTSSWNLEIIGRLFREKRFRLPASICDIGCAQLGQESDEIVRAFPGWFGKSVAQDSVARFGLHSYMGDLYKLAGFDYVSLDIQDAPFVRKFDLNVDRVPDDLRGRFDLVLNFGTSEHVMNQYNVFEVIHDLMKPGGLAYSMFLVNGFGPHGLLRYSSQFVDALASTNEYEVVFRETHRGPPGSIDECEWIVFRKGGSASFRPALDNIG
jgi:SAM-dependent methyltransferase